MPTSFHTQISPILFELERIQPKSLLDIGCGMGKFGVLTREYIPSAKRVDAVEGFESYIKELHRAVYDNIYVGDIRTMNVDAYSVHLIIDVIEHMKKQEGVDLCNKLKGVKIVATPKMWNAQGAEHGNDLETHRSHWTREDFFINFPGCRVEDLPSSWMAIID